MALFKKGESPRYFRFKDPNKMKVSQSGYKFHDPYFNVVEVDKLFSPLDDSIPPIDNWNDFKNQFPSQFQKEGSKFVRSQLDDVKYMLKVEVDAPIKGYEGAAEPKDVQYIDVTFSQYQKLVQVAQELYGTNDITTLFWRVVALAVGERQQYQFTPVPKPPNWHHEVNEPQSPQQQEARAQYAQTTQVRSTPPVQQNDYIIPQEQFPDNPF
jgi:hypothetical protein